LSCCDCDFCGTPPNGVGAGAGFWAVAETEKASRRETQRVDERSLEPELGRIMSLVSVSESGVRV
jgi:hypothetical protein